MESYQSTEDPSVLCENEKHVQNSMEGLIPAHSTMSIAGLLNIPGEEDYVQVVSLDTLVYEMLHEEIDDESGNDEEPTAPLHIPSLEDTLR